MAHKIRKDQNKVTKKIDAVNAGILFKIENWCSEHKSLIINIIFILNLLFIALHFNLKISEAHDDAMYIQDAYNFATNFFGFYTPNAPFYPMLLSPIIKFFGINLFLLKLTSVFFTIFNLMVFYFLFKDKISYLVLFVVLFIQAVNHYFIYYSSVTFTEQYFLFLQSLFFFLFFKAYNKGGEEPLNKLSNARFWIPSAFILFIMTLSRNIAIAGVLPLILFFIIDKKFFNLFLFFICFIGFRIPFEIIRGLIWGSKNQFAAQASSLIVQKDPYDASKGTEDLLGYFNRVVDNYGLYISKRFFQILGFLSEQDMLVRPGLGLIFFIIGVFSLILIIRKKNKYLILLSLYSVIMVGATFVAIQKSWDQYRLILVFIPFILVVILEPIVKYSFLNKSILQSILLVFFIVILFNSLLNSVVKAEQNWTVLNHNLKGDRYAGYTEDWVNFLKISKWCGDSLPPSSYVASRKAPMSFIYANGKEFYPIYTVSSSNADTILNELKSNNVTHVILASIRRNPNKSDGYIINTIHRLMQPVAQKYPDKFTLVKQIGESEPAYLYKINY
jgi:hypothetical protein